MFECTDKTSRYYIGKLTALIINKVYQIYHDCENKECPVMLQMKEAADAFVIRCVDMISTQEL